MTARKISAKELVKDITSGLSDAELMKKHQLSAKGLEGLFRKLVEASLLDPTLLRERLAKKGKGRGPSAPPADDPAYPGLPEEMRPAGQLTLITQDIKGGLHDVEIMRRHEMSPSKLGEAKAKLVEMGYLGPEQISPAESGKGKRCPFCSQQIQEHASRCVHCGKWLDAAASGAGTGRPDPGISAPESRLAGDSYDDKECPWEDRESYGTLNAYFQTATNCLFRPTVFFSKLPTTGGYLNPVLFGVFSVVVSAVLGYVWIRLFTGGGFGIIGFFIIMVFVILGTWLLVPAALFVFSAILHGCLHLVKGATEGYQATFRVVSYSSVTAAFNAVPIVGTIASLWGLVLTVIGLKAVHKTTTGKSVAAVMIPVGVTIVIAIVIAVVGFQTAAKKAQAIPRPAFSEQYTGGPLPEEVCTALEDFIGKIDFAKDLDPGIAKNHVQSAMQDLDRVLKRSEGHTGIDQVRQKAAAFAVATIARGQLKKALGGKVELPRTNEGPDALREELLQICGK